MSIDATIKTVEIEAGAHVLRLHQPDRTRVAGQDQLVIVGEAPPILPSPNEAIWGGGESVIVEHTGGGRSTYTRTSYTEIQFTSYAPPAALLNCPFCGQAPTIRKDIQSAAGDVLLLCTNQACPAMPCTAPGTLDETTNDWNTRR